MATGAANRLMMKTPGITSYPPGGGDPKHIEVKGRIAGATEVCITRNEILYAFNQGDKFVLAIVFVYEKAHFVAGPVTF